jgi:hypothetical protein
MSQCLATASPMSAVPCRPTLRCVSSVGHLSRRRFGEGNRKNTYQMQFTLRIRYVFPGSRACEGAAKIRQAKEKPQPKLHTAAHQKPELAAE